MSRFGQKVKLVEVKVCPIVKWLNKTENLSEMVWGGLFGTFSSQYQTAPNRDTCLWGPDYPWRGGRFG